jgi:probable rRNA maturation factor
LFSVWPSGEPEPHASMLEVEVFGARLLSGLLPQCEVERLCALALASAGMRDGHLAVEFVDAKRIADLNAEYRGKEGPTDVLSFPLDGAELSDAQSNDTGTTPNRDCNPSGYRDPTVECDRTEHRVPRELGDIVICPEHTVDLREAVVHGALHLVGMDHETDDGQMLAVQAEILRWGGS